MNQDDPKLTTREAAVYTNVSEASLSQMRNRGRGPAFIRLGPRTVRYAKSALDAWAEAGTVQPKEFA